MKNHKEYFLFQTGNKATMLTLTILTQHDNGSPSQCNKWKWSWSVVSNSATPWTVVAYQAPPSTGFSRQEEYWSGFHPGSSFYGILQARVLEWVAISFSRGSSRPRDQTQVSRIPGRCFNFWATREAPCNMGE